MGISAQFTVNGDTNPAEHIVAYGDTVQLALLSIVGADIIAAEIVASSFSGDPLPVVTLGGSPLGATATFTAPADPLDNLGRSFRFKYSVANTVENDVQYAVIGVPNVKFFIPLIPGEELERDRTHGWTQIINRALIAGNVAGPSSMGGDVTGTVTANTVSKIHGATVPVAGSLVTGDVLQVSGVASLVYGKIADANIASGAAIAVAKFAAGTQYQALVAGVAGAPQWGTVNVSQAAALSGVGADGRVAFAATGAFGFAAGLSFNSGTNVLTASGGLSTGGPVTATGALSGASLNVSGAVSGGAALFASARVTGLVGPGFVVAAPDGTLSIGAGAGSSFGLIYVATVALLEALSITGLPDRARAVVQEFPPGVDEFFLNLSGNDAAGAAMGVDHTNYLVLATAGAGAPKWLRRSN